MASRAQLARFPFPLESTWSAEEEFHGQVRVEAFLAWGVSRGEEVGAEEHGVDFLGDSGPCDADPLAFSVGEAFSKWQKTGTANELASSMVALRGPLHRVPLHGRGRVQRCCLRSFTL